MVHRGFDTTSSTAKTTNISECITNDKNLTYRFFRLFSSDMCILMFSACFKQFTWIFRTIFAILFFSSALFANPWVMFSDGRDTYIYNQKSGDIYVRFRKGGKNYEDVFVKMPQGQDPSAELSFPVLPSPNGSESDQAKLIQRAQELKNSLYSQPLE
ncbi:MAG: hypothetical protein ACTTJS_01875 [Wolinella sp.]